jgi:cytochrome c oxidase subunit 2
MRRRRARLLAIVTGAAVVTLAAAFAILRARPAATRPAAAVPAAAGAEVYARLGCPACHALRGTGNPRRSLDGVGSRLSRDDIRTWIVDPQRMKPGVRKPAYADLPAAELDAVLDYLQGA